MARSPRDKVLNDYFPKGPDDDGSLEDGFLGDAAFWVIVVNSTNSSLVDHFWMISLYHDPLRSMASPISCSDHETTQPPPPPSLPPPQHVHTISLSLAADDLRFISRTISAKTSLTLVLFLALLSTKEQPQICARAIPSTVGTSRCPSRSTLLPTRRIGTRSVPFTRVIWSRIVLMSCVVGSGGAFKIRTLPKEPKLGQTKTDQCSGMVDPFGRRLPLCFDSVMDAIDITVNRSGLRGVPSGQRRGLG